MPHHPGLTPADGRGGTPRQLVIGVGNDLRRDDGVGRVVAGLVADDPALAVEVQVTHQLVPELAELIRRYQRLVIVDAAVPDGGSAADGGDCGAGPHAVRLVAVSGPGASGLGHHGDGRRLLALAGLCGGPVPQAWLVTVPASDLGVGPGLSAATAACVGPAAALVARLLRRT